MTLSQTDTAITLFLSDAASGPDLIGIDPGKHDMELNASSQSSLANVCLISVLLLVLESVGAVAQNPSRMTVQKFSENYFNAV